MKETIKEIKTLIKLSDKEYGLLYDKVAVEFDKKHSFEEKTPQELFQNSDTIRKKWLRFENRIIDLVDDGQAFSKVDHQESEYMLDLDKFKSVKGYEDSFLKVREYILYSNQFNKLSDTFFQERIEPYRKNLMTDLLDANFPSPVKEIYEELSEIGLGVYKIPKNIVDFIRIFAIQPTQPNYFGLALTDGLEIDRTDNPIPQLIEEGYLPPVMKRFLVLGQYEHLTVGTWLYDEEKEDGEILGYDFETGSFVIISHSMKNFAKRGIECCKINVAQDWLEPNEATLDIIKSIDGDNVLPNSYEYKLDYYDDWLEHWQELLSEEDRNWG